MTAAPHLWRGLCQIADDLAAHGVPSPSDRWMYEAERFYLHPTAKTWLSCVGRGGGKNHVAIFCGLSESVHGVWRIPPGERHYFVEVGENTGEAAKTLRQWSAYLRLLDIEHRATADTIDFVDEELAHLGVKCLSCRIGAVSGFRSIGDNLQEVAKWSNEGINPAEEVAASAVAQTVTHPQARHRRFSSPLGTEGFFQEAVELGDTDHQIVTRGSSWDFNPAITEAATRLLEKDEKKWRREYLAEPQASQSSAFDPDAIDVCFKARRMPRAVVEGMPLIVIDAAGSSTGIGGDSFTYGLCRWVMSPSQTHRMEWRYSAFVGHHWDFVYDESGKEIPLPESERLRPTLKFEWMKGIEGGFWRSVTADKIVEAIKAERDAWGAWGVVGDQRENFSLSALFAQKGIRYISLPWTSANKPGAVELVRTWMRERTLWLPREQVKDNETRPHDRLRRELLAFEEKLTPSGQITFGARGKAHDDFVALLITAALAEQNRLLSLSPSAPRIQRYIPPGWVA